MSHPYPGTTVATSVTPKLQSLLLADKIYEDRATGKKVVAGIFHKLFFQKQTLVREVVEGGEKRVLIPGGMQSGSPSCYISLTDVSGRVKFELRYVSLKDETVLLKTGFLVESEDRLGTVEIILPLPTLPTLYAGVFALELLADDEPLGSLRVIVEEIQPPPTTES